MTQMKKEDQQQANPQQLDHKSQYAFCYTLGTVHILINQQINVEILRTADIYTIPHAPPWYKGTTSLRGAILPVVNMHFLLGIHTQPQQKPSKQTLLRLKHPDFPALVIVIDGLPYQTDIGALLTQTIPNQDQYPAWIESSANDHKKRYLFADYAALLTALQKNDQQQLVIPIQAQATQAT